MMERDQTTVTQETTNRTGCREVLFIMLLAIGEEKRSSYRKVRDFFDVILGLLSEVPALADRLAGKGTLAISESQQGFQIYALTHQGLINTWIRDSDAIRKACELQAALVTLLCRIIQMFDETRKFERGPVSRLGGPIKDEGFGTRRFEGLVTWQNVSTRVRQRHLLC